MRRGAAALLALALFAGWTQSANAQLTGTKNIPGDYATLADAITDLNLQGVGAGGVTLNLVAGNPQTAPAGGYVVGGAGSMVLTTTSAANPVVLEGNGNTVTASAALTAGALNDAIFKLIGADFITIQNFTMLENAANTVTAAGTNNMTEWGVALLYVTATDGAQNNTIQNNTITLNRTYQNTFGIYSNSTHTATAVTVSATATGAAGGNSGLRIYGNNISNVNQGIVVVGPTAAADHNTGIDIGGTAAATGNTITNYGSTGTFSGYANVSGTVYGILVRNSIGLNVSFNNITSSSGAAGVVSGTLRGIYVIAASNQPVGTFTNTVNNNTLSVTSHVAAGTLQGITVESTTSTATSTTNINNNNITTLTYSIAAASGTVTAISHAGSTTAGPLNHSISNNTFTNLSVATTGSFTFISNSWARPTNGIGNVNNNAIATAFSKTGVGGTVTLYTSNSTSGPTITEINTGNNFSNITVTGATTVAGWRSTDGGTPVKTVTGNTFSNWTGGTNQLTGLAVSFSGSANVSMNTVSNFNSAGVIVGIESTSGTQTFTNNTVTGLSSSGASSAVTGITVTGGTTQTLSNNAIRTLSGSGATSPVVNGISVSSGTTVNVSKNRICDLSQSGAISTTSPSVNGMLFSGGTTVTASNNLVGDLRAPAASLSDAIRGISVTSAAASSTYNILYNTVNIAATSSGANFGTTGMFHAASTTATTATLNLRNNIIVNNSTPNGTGLTVAYRRSSGAAGTLANYAGTSNNNDFYAGTPGASNLIYSDGTSTAQTIADYKGGVFTAGTIAPRDSISLTENPSFLSTACGNANFLHIDNTILTNLESGAVNIAGITDDVDGDIRQGNPGYAGTGTAPDIGADEFNGISAPQGACCLATGCIQTTQDSCNSQGGTAWTMGVDCASAGCPPTGRCCTVAGGCSILTQAACLATTGNAWDGALTCATPCTGACCQTDGSCAISTPAACTGCYSGDGTTCTFAFAESFDGVVAPALPAGWTTTTTAAPAWVTSTTTPDTAPNAVFIDDPAAINDKILISPMIALGPTPGTVTFRHNYTLESGFDGGVLEISIGGGAFADIVTAGGSFVTGGYNGTVSTCCGNPLAARAAWTGTAGGYITTTANLPASAANQIIQLRWRMGSDSSVSGTGWRVDTITIGQATCPLNGLCGACCVSGTCVIATQTNCMNQGGMFQGTGTTCPNPACAPVGACCAPSGVCTITDQTACLATPGNHFNGVGTFCDAAACPTGACCKSDNTCAVLTADGCAQFAGAIFRLGDVCGNCIGACCFDNGKCQALRQDNCLSQGGHYTADGVTCAAANCPPAGRCCMSDGSCSLLTATACQAAGGSYGGDNTNCNGGYVVTQSSGGTLVPGTTDIGNHTDDGSTLVALPFPVTFYGVVYNSANVGSNGYIDFTTAHTSGFFSNTCPLPTTAGFGPVILPYWDDFLLTGAGPAVGIFTSTTGSMPTREFHIEWRAPFYNSGSPDGLANFEVRFYEGQSFFDVFYGTMNPGTTGGNGGTLGIQASGTGPFTQFACSTTTNNFPAAGTVLRYAPQPLCPQPGACCNNGSCTITLQAACTAGGGMFQGEGSSCSPNPCFPAAIDCPTFDMNRDALADGDDIPLFVEAYLTGPSHPLYCSTGPLYSTLADFVNWEITVPTPAVRAEISCGSLGVYVKTCGMPFGDYTLTNNGATGECPATWGRFDCTTNMLLGSGNLAPGGGTVTVTVAANERLIVFCPNNGNVCNVTYTHNP